MKLEVSIEFSWPSGKSTWDTTPGRQGQGNKTLQAAHHIQRTSKLHRNDKLLSQVFKKNGAELLSPLTQMLTGKNK